MRCRYLVDISWFKQWKKFVGFDSWDMFGVGDPSLFPGPVDNSGLFSGEWRRGAQLGAERSVTARGLGTLTGGSRGCGSCWE